MNITYLALALLLMALMAAALCLVGGRRFRPAQTSADEATVGAILEAAVDGIITIDSRGHIERFNPAAERIFGYHAAEVIGRNVSLLMPEPDRGRHDQYIANYQRTGNPKIIGKGREVRGLRKDGSTFPMYLAVGEARLGRRRLYAGIVRDISQRIAQEEALRHAKEYAERADRSKSKFLAAASHDLRQPVQALFFFVAALRGRLKDSGALRILDDLERSLGALKMLLDSLLDISKLDAGVVTASRSVFCIDSVLERVAADFVPLAREKGVALRRVASSAHVESDPALLTRIVQNLVANAVRYTDNGRVLVGCRRRGAMLRIEVWDTGIGIAPDNLKQIFHEFYQVGNDARDRAQGLGLGLAIVERLTRLLGHRLEVRSLLTRGSMFAVNVPLAVPPAARPHYPLDLPTNPPGRGLVVVIDDDPAVLRGLRFILQQWGYEVLARTSADEVVRHLVRRPGPPQAIIADYRLAEGLTGANAIASIRALYGRDIRSIIITGDPSLRERTPADAADVPVLSKPVEPPVLWNLLANDES